MEHGANATELFAFVGGDRYGPPATTVRGYSNRYGPLRPVRHHGAPRASSNPGPVHTLQPLGITACMHRPHTAGLGCSVCHILCVCAQVTRAAADMHASLAGRASSAAWRRRNATTA